MLWSHRLISWHEGPGLRRTVTLEHRVLWWRWRVTYVGRYLEWYELPSGERAGSGDEWRLGAIDRRINTGVDEAVAKANAAAR